MRQATNNHSVEWPRSLVINPNEPHFSRSGNLCRTLEAALEFAGSAGITRVADVGGLDDSPLSVVSVIRPAARSICLSSGKGLTLLEACVSGLMEALELHYAETFDQCCRVAEVPGDILMPAFSGYPKIARSGAEGSDTSDTRVTLGVCLRTGTEAAVPFDLIHVDLRTGTAFRRDGFVVSSNGLGAGQSREAAVVHGLCEVIEGDAVALFQASGRRRGIPVHANRISDSATSILIAALQERAIDVTLCEITTDVGVPVFYCSLTEIGTSPLRLPVSAAGTGCHPNGHVAMRRALMEAVQTRVLLISGARDDITPEYYAMDLSPAQMTAQMPAVLDGPISELPGHASVEWVVGRLASAGFMHPIAVDISPHCGALSFVRVVVPGLEGYPFARGYIPGSRARSARVT
ncbi:YcaO-like family protein [Mesorhizobium sp. 10J20-29]